MLMVLVYVVVFGSIASKIIFTTVILTTVDVTVFLLCC